jgi:hypothetical protein
MIKINQISLSVSFLNSLRTMSTTTYNQAMNSARKNKIHTPDTAAKIAAICWSAGELTILSIDNLPFHHESGTFSLLNTEESIALLSKV